MLTDEYRFYLTIGLTEQQVFPVWGNGLELSYQKEDEQQFFRRKLNGDLTFKAADFNLINNAPFASKFVLLIKRRNGDTFTDYWNGFFFKTDCEFDYDAKSVKVTPTCDDGYNEILEALDKEYNLSELGIAEKEIKYDIRPKVQIYHTDADNCTNLIGSVQFTQKCNEFSYNTANYYDLRDTHHFLPLGVHIYIDIFDTHPSTFAAAQFGGYIKLTNDVGTKRFRDFANEGETDYYYYADVSFTPGALVVDIYKYDNGSTTHLYHGGWDFEGKYWLLVRQSDSSEYYAGGTAGVVFARMLLNNPTISGQTAYPVNSAFSQETRYTYCIAYGIDDIIASTQLLPSPTRWGEWGNSGRYYAGLPAVAGSVIPACRSSWSWVSLWYPIGGVTSIIVEPQGRTERTITTYTFAGLITALMQASSVPLTFTETSDCSDFLYNPSNPISGWALKMFIFRKSRFLTADNRPQGEETPLSLMQVFDFLRDTFRCYWFVEDGKLRIEHISYFMKGGSYSSLPEVGINLLDMQARLKKWSFGQSKFSFEKSTMPCRYEFGWMDEVSEPFVGLPMNIVSPIVEKSRTEKINILNITTDIDFVMSNPNEISKDGFIAVMADENNKVAYFTYEDEAQNEMMLQNGYLSFTYLQRFYLYDLPTIQYRLGEGAIRSGYGTKRSKTQDVTFPSIDDIDVSKLVRTSIGDGQIEEASINLSSRGAAVKLKYPTE